MFVILPGDQDCALAPQKPLATGWGGNKQAGMKRECSPDTHSSGPVPAARALDRACVCVCGYVHIYMCVYLCVCTWPCARI